MMNRGRWVVVGVASTVVVALVGLTAFYVVRGQQRTSDVAEADRVAAAFDRRADDYRADVRDAVFATDLKNALAVKKALDAAAAQAPELGDAPTWGRDHSDSYAAALKAERSLTEPYDELSARLVVARTQQTYVKAATTALKPNLDDFLESGSFFSGAPVRDKIGGGFTKVLKTYEKVTVPRDAKAVDQAVTKALKTVLAEAELVADGLDAGRSGKIDARDEYADAGQALLDYADVAQTDITREIREATTVARGTASST